MATSYGSTSGFLFTNSRDLLTIDGGRGENMADKLGITGYHNDPRKNGLTVDTTDVAGIKTPTGGITIRDGSNTYTTSVDRS